MIKSLWISKTGLDAQQTQLDVIANNLANVGTTGFKRARVAFEELLYQNMRQAGTSSSEQTQLPTGLQTGTGVRPTATPRMFTQGNLQNTGNQFDVAINGNGFFQVQLPDGNNAYTRDGSFHVDSNGQLVTINGFAVQPAITVPPNALAVTIGRDGTVTATVPGQVQPQNIGTLQLASFTNPGGLESKGQNLFVETQASGTPSTNTAGTNGLGLLQQGYLETSNVNVVEELVSMIQTQRAYEINSKAIQTSDQILARLTQI
jgi:flagellar basal-body rod protein FlgG